MGLSTGTTDEFQINTLRGRLYGRRWSSMSEKVCAPIVLLHDSLGCVELWRTFPAELAAATGRSVIAYDRLGFGHSDAQEEQLPLDFIRKESTSDFAAVLAHFNVGKFVVMGHSVGGAMALCVAADNPERCLGVVAESAQTFAEDATLAGIREAQRAFESPDQLKRLARYHGSKAEWVLKAWTETWLAPGFASWSLEGILPAVLCPVLVIRGTLDEYGSDLHARMVMALVRKDVSFEQLAGVGHVPHKETSIEVQRLIAEFSQALFE